MKVVDAGITFGKSRGIWGSEFGELNIVVEKKGTLHIINKDTKKKVVVKVEDVLELLLTNETFIEKLKEMEE